MVLSLHNPVSEAHLEELKDRLAAAIAGRALGGAGAGLDAVEKLLDVVRSMDRGAISTADAQAAFARDGLPGFRRWLDDMIDEGVYLEVRLDRAA